MEKPKGHQGDVQFKPASIPEGVKKIEKEPFAYGEVHGHVHVMAGDYEMYDAPDSDLKYVRVGEKGAVLHHTHESSIFGDILDHQADLKQEDHGLVSFPPGEYVFGIHNEFDPFEEEMRRVTD